MTTDFDLSTLLTVSSLLYFVIGLLVGVILKKAFILVVEIVAIVTILLIAGLVTVGFSIPSLVAMYAFFNLAKPAAGTAATQAGDLVKLLPLTSFAFLIGVLIGLWKG